MRLPGLAWLDFEVRPDGDGARLVQRAMFDPMGLWGLAYWYAVWPLHQFIFAGMLRGLGKAAEENGPHKPSASEKPQAGARPEPIKGNA